MYGIRISSWRRSSIHYGIKLVPSEYGYACMLGPDCKRICSISKALGFSNHLLEKLMINQFAICSFEALILIRLDRSNLKISE